MSAVARRRSWRRFGRHRLALLGTFVLLALVLISAVGPMVTPYDSLSIDILHRFAPPFSGPHWLGTDPLGRDLLTRLMLAGRVSLTVGFVAMLISTVFGVIVGVLAGYYGPPISTVLMRLVDAMLCFPTIFLLLTVAAFLQAGLVTITLIIAATAWMDVARLMEGQMRALKSRDYAVAAEALGASDWRIMVVELLPNAVAPVVVTATLQVARAILTESYISFLGYGIQPPTPTWGNMLKDAQQYLDTAPWLAIVPGIAITLAVTSFNFIGDGLRDALDPRMDRG
jgi:peptide/nickel transport system permease protein